MRSLIVALGLLPVLLLPALGIAGARPLDEVTCGQLDKERVALEAVGVLADLRLKSDEIKVLAKDRLLRMGRYVDVSGDVLFRCPSALHVANEARDEPTKTPAAVTSKVAKAVPALPHTGKRALQKKRH